MRMKSFNVSSHNNIQGGSKSRQTVPISLVLLYFFAVEYKYEYKNC